MQKLEQERLGATKRGRPNYAMLPPSIGIYKMRRVKGTEERRSVPVEKESMGTRGGEEERDADDATPERQEDENGE